MKARINIRWYALSWVGVLLSAAVVPPLTAQEQVDVATVEKARGTVPEDFTVRGRVTQITPSEPSDLTWRWGGEGLGGLVTHGTLAKQLPVGEWSPPVPVNSLKKGNIGRLFVTFETGIRGSARRGAPPTTQPPYSTDVVMELEFSYKDKVLKTLKLEGPEGGSMTILVPGQMLAGRSVTDKEFLDELVGIREYATRRADRVEKLPWASWPTPKKFVFVNNMGGWGRGINYGIRTTDMAVMEAEARTLRQIGTNAIRDISPEFLQMVVSGQGFAKDFGRAIQGGAAGYPVLSYRAGRTEGPETGCPFHPNVAQRSEEGVKRAVAEALAAPVPEYWGLTVDEIGAVFDQSEVGKRHPALCPLCAEGYRQYLKDQGRSPADFGMKDWGEVKPLDLIGPPKPRAGAKDAEKAKDAAAAPAAESQPAEPPWQKPDLSDKYTALAAYHTTDFVNYASSMLFRPLKDAYNQANQAKQAALAAGQNDSPAAKQPWIYSFALRGNNFLMASHSLDFFTFYRNADNAFVYETSNRAPQVWGWDSYLCDVGRGVSAKMNKVFGIYVKPHRGAPVQRALTAVSRGARMIYWYTYGPDWSKGDCFSERPDALDLAAKGGHLIGKTEDALYGAAWARPAEVAIVKPWTSSIWMRLTGTAALKAAWENAKWTYTALQHAHVPVDAIDEVMLATEDLSKYKIIYVNGPNITRAAAAALEKYVKEGGTLYTSGGGLALDEGNQPLKAMDPVLGLAGRTPPDMYYTVSLYGGSGIESYNDSRMSLRLRDMQEQANKVAAEQHVAPEQIKLTHAEAIPDSAQIIGTGPFAAKFKPLIGCELLKPLPTAEVLVKFADGSPAVVRNKYGKGQAYVVGFFPGLEYSALIRGGEYDMSRDLPADRRSFVAAPALGLVQPVVDASQALVEGVLLKNAANGKRSVTLMNWAYGLKPAAEGRRGGSTVAIVPFENLTLRIRGAGEVTKVTSAMLDKELAVKRDGDLLTVTLPRLEEGDVLLLE